MIERLKPLQSDLLVRATGVKHGFFSRQGGVSQQEFESLNCSFSSGDEMRRLLENRRRVALTLELEPENLVTLSQIHGCKVRRVASTAYFRTAKDGDGLVTRQTGIGLGIVTADCAPILFADTVAGVIGAAHAGWGGALKGVAEAVLQEMCALGALRDRIVAAIGPCIQVNSYRVDEAFYERFMAQSPFDADPYFRDRIDGCYFDLPAYVARRLYAADIRYLDQLAVDTYSDEARFFSYRRSTHCGESQYGRQLSVVSLRASNSGN